MKLKGIALITLIAYVHSTEPLINEKNINLRSNNSKNMLISNELTNTIKCSTGSGDTCVCPGGCMVPVGNHSDMCQIKKCWYWDIDETKCKGAGPKWVPAIVLQAVPFTGVFGAGFGNMGRWDLFGIAIGIWGGVCLVGCLLAILLGSSDDSSSKSLMSCYNCLVSIAIMAYWVWGIVVIADKYVLGGNGCPLVD